MKQAAIELATRSRRRSSPRAASNVAVMIAQRHRRHALRQAIRAQVAPARLVLTDPSRIFNLWLRDQLTGQPVQIIDTFCAVQEP